MTPLLRHWSAGPVILTVYVIVAAAHLRGLRWRAPLRRGDLREAVAFQGGLAAVLLTLVSPVGYWSGRYLWAHMTQDVILAGVAAPLFVLGAPWTALARGVPLPGRLRIRWRESRPAMSSRASIAAGGLRWLARPIPATAAFNVVWIGWHLPVLYDLTRSSAVHYLQFSMVLGFAVLLWLQLVGSHPWSPSLEYVKRIPLIFFSAAITWLLAMVIAFTSSTLYPAYAAGSYSGLPASADQQFAGAIIWTGIEPALIVIMIFTAYRWLRDEEEDPLYGVAKLLRRRTSGWDSPLSLGTSARNKNRHL